MVEDVEDEVHADEEGVMRKREGDSVIEAVAEGETMVLTLNVRET